MTSGNHIWDKREIFNYIENAEKLIRPLNYPRGTHGEGYKIFDFNGVKIAVINLLGQVFMNTVKFYWEDLPDLIEEIKNRTAEDVQIPSVARERLFSMMQFIHSNYADKITLEDIANSAAISSRECLRCFNLCLRETPIEYLTNHRVNMAKELLRNTNKSITDIAFETGFSNAAYFTKVFKQIRQITPKEYRDRITNPF